MTGERQKLADRLAAALPATWDVQPVAREFQPDPGVPVYVAIMRQVVRPAPNAQGAWGQTFAVWVILNSAQDSAELEDRLDEALDQVLEVLDADGAVVMPEANRDTYGEAGLHSWRLEVQAYAEKV